VKAKRVRRGKEKARKGKMERKEKKNLSVSSINRARQWQRESRSSKKGLEVGGKEIYAPGKSED